MKIGLAGTDGRTVLGALEISRTSNGEHEGIVFRGMPGMKEFVQQHEWPVTFIETDDNGVNAYATAVIDALQQGIVDAVIPMPEALQFDGIVDLVTKAGFGERIVGLTAEGSRLEGDKIWMRELCKSASLPSPEWDVVDARDWPQVRSAAMKMFARHGGAVLKYPYSAGGKGARVVTNLWDLKVNYDDLMEKQSDGWRKVCGESDWPLLIERRLAGVEISFTVLVDKHGHFQILPTSLDYPERFPGAPGIGNPITGGMGAISPHPFDSDKLRMMAASTIVEPLVEELRNRGLLRPCILYPGCMIGFTGNMEPDSINVLEFNVRFGEPDCQPTIRRTRNFGALVAAMFTGELDRVQPEVRLDQVSMTIALVTGPGGPKGQKGYPWSVTKNEPVIFGKAKKILIVPSGLGYDEERDVFTTDGTRVVYLSGNAQVKTGSNYAETAQALRERLVGAFENGLVRAVPREDQNGQRLVIREDVGVHFGLAHDLMAD